MSAKYTDIDGNKISLEQWAKLCEQPDYKRVDLWENKKAVISTVWLGLDHNFQPNGEPLYFETMTFAKDTGSDDANYSRELDCVRYSTIEQAREGHAAAIMKELARQQNLEDHLKIHKAENLPDAE